MLRRIRVKLRPPLLHPRAGRYSSSAAAVRVKEDREDHRDPYGTEYGAGPSRIPYEPLSQRLPHMNGIQTQQAPTSDVPQSSTPAPKPNSSTAQQLRRFLHQLPAGAISRPDTFLRNLFMQPQLWTNPKLAPGRITDGAILENVPTLTRLELHIIIHHLIRRGTGSIAAVILSQALAAAPRHRRRRLVSFKTLKMMFRTPSSFTMPSAKSMYNHAPPKADLHPTIEQQQNPPPSRELWTLLNILECMQDVRARRPPEFYQVIILTAVIGHQFDLAAKIYVGLVEEWVTEGRVAHGADPDDFHPGGGPPRDGTEEKAKMSELLAHWWTGVRTWRFPGEALSPHDRLDLWHPKHLSLGEKMRNFPLPLATSPPTMVPQPHSALLRLIVNSLRLDPRTATPAEFASSMRALAILANTVLSRTLPIHSLGRLLHVFKSAPLRPEVYPDHITSTPTNDAWAFTSYTQIHVTLMSLLFSPPMSSHSMDMIAANQDVEVDSTDPRLESAKQDRPAAVSRYMLPPLSWGSCNILLQYAFGALRRPQLLKRLMTYMKDKFSFGDEAPQAYSNVLHGSSKLRDNQLAMQADVALFGKSSQKRNKDRPSHAPPPHKDPREALAALRLSKDVDHNPSGIHIPMVEHEGVGPIPDETALINLVSHLTASSQFGRLEDLIYKLEPFLDFAKSMPDEEVESRLRRKGVEPGISGRPRSQPLTPRVYLALLKGFEKAGSTGLAQRVFDLALIAEGRMAVKMLAQADAVSEEAQAEEDGTPKSSWKSGLRIPSEESIVHVEQVLRMDVPILELPSTLRLPLELYVAMMNVWANESRAARRAIEAEKGVDPRLFVKEIPVGWTVPHEYRHLPRGSAAGWMSVRLHQLVKRRFEPRQLTERYYLTVIKACRWRWKLSDDQPVFTGFRPEIMGLIADIEASGHPVPDLLVAKLENRRKGTTGSRVRWHERPSRDETTEQKLLKRIMGDADPDELSGRGARTTGRSDV